MKVIFLDFDGVLNGYEFFSVIGWRIACFLHIHNWYRKHTRHPYGLHKEKFRNLCKIVNATNAKIVLSATMRFAYWNTPYNEKDETLKSLTDLCDKNHIEIIGITPKAHNRRRETEIKQWLSEHEGEVENFVILDDESADLQCFVNTHLVKTRTIVKGGSFIRKILIEKTGLRKNHVKKAIKILEGGL